MANSPVPSMKLPTLYEITDDYLRAFIELSELDMPENVVNDTLEGLQYPLEQKALAVAQMARNMEALAEQIIQAKREMEQRAKGLNERAERMRAYLKDNMERAGIPKIESVHFNLTIKKNPPALEIALGAQIPDEYMRIPPIPQAEPDKAKLKEALKAGVIIEGCELKQATRLDIK